MIGEKFGHYKIKSRLGAGGMGDVYLADEQKTYFTREVVLKLVKDELNQAGKSRFLDEMRMLASLEHENIARMYDGGSEDGRLFIAMEYVRSGVNLRQFMLNPQTGKQTALPLGQVISVTKQACEGLEAAHRKGIIHRDLKPENIIVIPGEEGLRVKIIDFGIAASIAPGFLPDTDRQLTQGICGTPAYLSPEQAAGKNRSEIDHRSDVYSLGLVAYEMLTGVLAFQGNFASLLRLHQENDPHPITQYCPQLGPQLGQAVNAVVMKALRKHPDQRHQSVKEFARELEATIERPVQRAPIPTVQQRPPLPTVPVQTVPAYKPWPLSRWILLGFVGTVVLTISIFGMFVMQAVYKKQLESAQATIDSNVGKATAIKTDSPSGHGNASSDSSTLARATSSKLVGTWQSDVVENGVQTKIIWQANADGTCTYLFITPNGEVTRNGNWRFSEGALRTSTTEGTEGAGQIRWIDADHFEVTILFNGDPGSSGLKRRFSRATE